MYELKTKPATLVIGIGNKGRNDDGLGWNFAAFIEQMRLPKVSIEYRYQLQIEDAYLISQYERIFFADTLRMFLSYPITGTRYADFLKAVLNKSWLAW